MVADTTFLNATLEEHICRGFQDGYPEQDKKSTGLDFIRSPCGLKQSSRLRLQLFSTYLGEFMFTQLPAD